MLTSGNQIGIHSDMAQHFNPDRLEALRLAHGLTRTEFASRIGVSRQIIHAWITGKTKPTVSTVERVAKAFNLESRFFFSDAVNQIGEQEVA